MSMKPKYHKILKEKQAPNGATNYTLQYNSELFKQGACVGINTELFYPVEERENPDYIIKKLCGQCPIQVECLEWGLAHEVFGTWGGATAKARKAMRRKLGWTVSEITLYPTREELNIA